MKNLSLFLFSILFFFLNVSAQEEKPFVPSGEVYGIVYTHFFASLDSDLSAFEVSRAYLGYKYKISEEFTANIKLDIGSINDESQYALIRRYTYFKNACLNYKKNKLNINVGLIDLSQFKIQEKFMDQRYIYKSFQDQYKLGSSADIGISGNYEFNKYILVDITLMNGEGYKDFQSDNSYKYGAGLTIKPFDGLLLRLYYDHSKKCINQSTYSAFVGYEYKKLGKIGFEYSTQINNNFYENQDFGGYSGFLHLNLTDKLGVFGRYDKLMSNRVFISDVNVWNYNNDGQLVLTGLQFKLHEKIRVSGNVQFWIPENVDEDMRKFLFVNLEFCF